MKKSKAIKQFHTPSSQTGSGDYHGTAIKNPVGKIREVYPVNYNKPKSIGQKPKSLA